MSKDSLSPEANGRHTQRRNAGEMTMPRYIEREVPIRLPDQGGWKLGDPLTPDMILVCPDHKRRRAPDAELPKYVVE
jgi:hypothetical protein